MLLLARELSELCSLCGNQKMSEKLLHLLKGKRKQNEQNERDQRFAGRVVECAQLTQCTCA